MLVSSLRSEWQCWWMVKVRLLASLEVEEVGGFTRENNSRSQYSFMKILHNIFLTPRSVQRTLTPCSDFDPDLVWREICLSYIQKHVIPSVARNLFPFTTHVIPSVARNLFLYTKHVIPSSVLRNLKLLVWNSSMRVGMPNHIIHLILMSNINAGELFLILYSYSLFFSTAPFQWSDLLPGIPTHI